MKQIVGIKKIYNVLKQLKYASEFDKYLALYNLYHFENRSPERVTMVQQQYDNVTMLTYNVKFKSNPNNDETQRVVIYPSENLAYTVNSKVFSFDEHNIICNPPEPQIPLFSFENSDYVSFKFVRFNTDVFLNIRVREQILTVIHNFIVNHLTGLGIGCFIPQFSTSERIVIFTPSQYRNRMYDYLCSLDWQNILSPFRHLFSRLKVSDKFQRTYEFNPMVSNELQLIIKYRGDSGGIELEIEFDDKDFVKNHDDCDYNYDEIDGWSLMPQFKPLYTRKEFTSNPIYDFVIYGRVPQINIHEKYLPIWRAGVLRVFGIRINDVEYWFSEPIYVQRFYKPRRSEIIAWHTYLATRNHVTFI
jgi:hypothetical protein